ncbi:MAG TPA: hypothetical protein PJ994_03625 [Tepidiformaceae bacterium]|nr:hypothetical protein [Tepidiformaceae bacterium]
MRRTLLLALALPAAVMLLACGGNDDGSNGTPDAFPTSHDPARNVPEDQRNKVNIVVAGSDWFVGTNNFVFGITDLQDQPQGGAEALVTFYDIRDSANPKPVITLPAVQSAPGVGEIIEHRHGDGEIHLHGGQDENRVGYYVTVDFPHAGPWGFTVEATLKDGTKGTTSVGFRVFEKPNMPAPGQAAYRSDNLTKHDVADISEIDSGVPLNDLHDVKIKDAIEAGRPLVIVFSTPAFCTSRFCGPVNEEVETLHEKYRDDVDFVHIEVWRNFNRQQMNPTAREWLIWPDGSLREPIVYVVDKDGIIFDRWEGPVAANIMEESVRAVAEGATYQ